MTVWVRAKRTNKEKTLANRSHEKEWDENALYPVDTRNTCSSVFRCYRCWFCCHRCNRFRLLLYNTASACVALDLLLLLATEVTMIVLVDSEFGIVVGLFCSRWRFDCWRTAIAPRKCAPCKILRHFHSSMYRLAQTPARIYRIDWMRACIRMRVFLSTINSFGETMYSDVMILIYSYYRML